MIRGMGPPDKIPQVVFPRPKLETTAARAYVDHYRDCARCRNEHPCAEGDELAAAVLGGSL